MANSLKWVPLAMCLATPATASVRVLFLGDSLTAGAGVGEDHAFPAILGRQLQKEGYSLDIINAGINGSTTDSAFDRLCSALKFKPAILVLALGANDGLRGHPVTQIRRNLEKTLELAKREHLLILFVGIKTLPFHGDAYAAQFDALFPDLAKKYDVPFIPFLLEGVALQRDLNLPDGFHPNEKGHEAIAATVIGPLRQLLGPPASKTAIQL